LRYPTFHAGALGFFSPWLLTRFYRLLPKLPPAGRMRPKRYRQLPFPEAEPVWPCLSLLNADKNLEILDDDCSPAIPRLFVA
jgi:hypothetical protein